jgi:hypothetical protein
MSYITQAAQVDMIADILRDPCTLRLYSNDVGEEPTAADFIEVEGGGYVGKPMRAQTWDLSRAPEEAKYPPQKFSFTGPAGRVAGYFITRNSDGKLRWFDPLPGGPIRIMNAGYEIEVDVSTSFAASSSVEQQTEEQ